MYRKDSEGWLKHFDFLVLDMLCLQVAFVLAYGISGYGFFPYNLLIYRNMAIFIEFADIVVLFACGTLKSVLKRGHYREFLATFQNTIMLGAVAISYLFLLQQGQKYSRLALILNMILYFFLTYIVREIRKYALYKKMKDSDNRSLLIITTKEAAEKVVSNMEEHNYARFHIAGLAIIDENMVGNSFGGVTVVANRSTAPEYVCKEWIDEVFVVLPPNYGYPKELMKELGETGVTIHLNLTKITNEPGKRQFVEKIGDYTVLTTSLNYASAKQLCAKRCMDIAGGLAGCILTGVIFLFVAPIIYMQSPGPIFFSQERVGKNGKKFKMYKFRSMYMDAEERKKELMKQNRVKDGMMFKLEWDPRIIGTKKLPDGTIKKGIGNIIRDFSLDEFPQFFNVLKGDMSLVGTRPPTVDEWEKYDLHHRARLATKPGITGMWQVSGRSNITDFEDVVKLDRQYIAEWNFALDIKILFKTVLVVFKRDGAM